MSDSISLFTENDNAPLSATRTLGDEGERLAVRHLERKGYTIVMTNFITPIGRNSKGVSVTGEVDVIAIDRSTLVFAEVKSRRSEGFTTILSAIDKQKQRQIIRTARAYRRMFCLLDMPFRYDAITVLMPHDRDPVVEHFPSFWTESSLAKKQWRGDQWYDFA
jgi:putative endonuclease